MHTAPAIGKMFDQTALASLWAASFVLCLAIPFVLLGRGYIGDDALLPVVRQMSGLYAPHVGVILAYYFVSKKHRRGRGRDAAFFVSLAASAIWNAVVLTLMVPTLWGDKGLVQAAQLAADVAPLLSWLVAPALGYFFAANST